MRQARVWSRFHKESSSALTRLRSGNFRIEDAVALDRVRPDNLDEIGEKLISLADGLSHMSRAVVVAHAAERLRHGSALGVSEIIKFESADGAELIRIVGKDGRLLAVGAPEGPPLAGFPFGSIRPKRVLE